VARRRCSPRGPALEARRGRRARGRRRRPDSARERARAMRARRASPPSSFPSRLVPESADRVGDDAAVVLVPQAPPYELLGHGRGQISHLAPELLSGTADIGIPLGLRRFDETPRFGAGGFREAALRLPRLP